MGPKMGQNCVTLCCCQRGAHKGEGGLLSPDPRLARNLRWSFYATGRWAGRGRARATGMDYGGRHTVPVPHFALCVSVDWMLLLDSIIKQYNHTTMITCIPPALPPSGRTPSYLFASHTAAPSRNRAPELRAMLVHVELKLAIRSSNACCCVEFKAHCTPPH